MTFSEASLLKNFTKCLDKAFFPNELKCAEVVPVYIKKDKNDKNNYRPVSILVPRSH